MRILLDTNVLLRLEDLDQVQHAIPRSAVDSLHANGHMLVLAVSPHSPQETKKQGPTTDRRKPLFEKQFTAFQKMP